MHLDIAPARNPEALFKTLRGVDLSVPGRTEGRKTYHAETWTICRLLSTLAAANRFTFPISVTHRDRPDFLIQDASAKIGVEVTEAIPEQYAAYCALAERDFPGVLRELAHFRLLSSAGWEGDDPEREWALFIRSAVDTKLTKLARTDFMKFDQNWLSIYDNLPMPNINLAEAIGLLRPLLEDRWSGTSFFDTLLVEHGPVIARVTAKGSDHLVLKDLWE